MSQDDAGTLRTLGSEIPQLLGLGASERVSRGGTDRKKGRLAPLLVLNLLYLILPAIFAASLAVLLERDQTLAAHRERRIQERLLVELRKSGL
jgi:hypothetical protein